MSTRAGRREKEIVLMQSHLGTLGLLAESGAVRATSLDMTLIFKGRDPRDDATLDLWGKLGQFFGGMQRGLKWWIADWLNFGEERFAEGERYAQVMEATGLSYGYLANIARVGRGIAPSRRLPGVSFSLHEEVYTLPPTDQTRWLKEATSRDPVWTQRELRQAIKTEAAGGVEPLFDDDEHGSGNGHDRVNAKRVVEAARLALSQARVNGSEVTIPLETYRQLQAAFGRDE